MTAVKRSRRRNFTQVNNSIICNLLLNSRTSLIPMGPKFSVQSHKSTRNKVRFFQADWTIVSFLEIFLDFHYTKIIVKPIPTYSLCVHNSELKIRIQNLLWIMYTSLYFFLVNYNFFSDFAKRKLFGFSRVQICQHSARFYF